jgi:arginase
MRAAAARLPKIAVFGVPSAAGASGPGSERGAFALREAGLLDALGGIGARVVNLSDLSLFPWREDPEHPRARNLPLAACAARATADEMPRALAEGFTLLIGGDCSILAGSVGGTARALGRPVSLVYLDADLDLNTPDTTPSGNLNGMAVAAALGRGASELVAASGAPALLPEHVAILGYRAVDPGERAPQRELALTRSADEVRASGAACAAADALAAVGNDGGPLLVHLDVDVIDASELGAKAPFTPGPGLRFAEIEALLTTLMHSPRVVVLEVCEFSPLLDPGGASARKLVALLTKAVAARLSA